MSRSCICSECQRRIDCTGGIYPVCDLCEGVIGEIREPRADREIEMVVQAAPDDRQVLNILQRLHQDMLRENEPYVGYAKDCRWQFSSGSYACEHVIVSESEVIDTHRRQMEN